MKQKSIVLLVMVSVMLLLLAAGPTPAPAAPDRVKVAYMPIMNFAPLYVAVGRGFMQEQNIEVEMQKVTSGSDAMAFLAQGTLDAAGVGIQASTFTAFSRGFELRIIASAAIQPLKDGPTVLIVSKDMIDSGKVKSVADLKGKKVAMAGGSGTTGAYFVAKVIKESGLTMKDIEVVNLGAPDMPLAIEKGSIDAALAGPPYSDAIISRGKGVVLAKDMAPGAMTTVFMYSEKFMKERPEVAKRFMIALVKGSRAMQGDKYLNPANMKAYLQFVTSTEETIRKGARQINDPDLKVYIDTIKDMEGVYRWAGWTTYTSVIPPEKMADTSFVENAVRVLGPYKP